MSDRWPALLAVTALVACAPLIGLDEAAGEREPDGATSNASSSTGATTSTATASSANGGGAGGGPGGGASSSDAAGTGGGSSGGGGGEPVGGGSPEPQVTWIEGESAVDALQAADGGAVHVALRTASPTSVDIGAGCTVAGAPPGDLALDVVRFVANGGCDVHDRQVITGLEGEATISPLVDVRAIAADRQGDYIGWGGEVRGAIEVGDGQLQAPSLRPFAWFASLGGIYVGIPPSDATATGIGSVMGLGDGGAFVGSAASTGDVFAWRDDAEVVCQFSGGGVAEDHRVHGFRVGGVSCEKVDNPTNGFVVDVASDATRAAVIYRRTMTGEDEIHIRSFHFEEPTSERFARTLYLAPAGPVEAQAAIDGENVLVGIVTSARVLCGDDDVSVTGANRGVGLRLDVTTDPPTCEASWSHPDLDLVLPLARIDGEDLFAVRRPLGRPGWFALGVRGDALRARHLCDGCSIDHAAVAGARVWIAGIASGSAILGEPPPGEAASAFLATVHVDQLMDGAVAW
jgi:hypothetical protein